MHSEGKLAAADVIKFPTVLGVHVKVLGGRRSDLCEKRPGVSLSMTQMFHVQEQTYYWPKSTQIAKLVVPL